MEEYYTVADICTITGYEEEEALIIIKRLNEEIIEKYSKEGKRPLVFDRMIESWYFLRRMDIIIGG